MAETVWDSDDTDELENFEKFNFEDFDKPSSKTDKVDEVLAESNNSNVGKNSGDGTEVQHLFELEGHIPAKNYGWD